MDILPTISTGATIAACLTCILLGCDSATEDEGVDKPRAESAVAVEEAAEPQVVAVVNDREIQHDEVERRLERLDEIYRYSRRPFDDATRAKKREQVVERLIDRELLRDHLAHRDVEISGELVDQQLEKRVHNEFGTSEAFHRFLKAQNITLEDFRERVHEEIAIKELLVSDEAPIEIDENRLREHYERIANRRPADDRIQTSMMIVELPERLDEPNRQQIHQELQDSLDDIENAKDLRDLPTVLRSDIRIHLDDERWIERQQMPVEMANHLFGEDAPSSGLSEVLETARGFEVYWIHERREAGVRGFDEVEGLLRDRAHRSQLEKRRRDLVFQLRQDADITINMPLEPNHPPLSER